jgi:hypothetical protein
MNKLEKQKLEEIEQDLYRLNSVISLFYIGLKEKPTQEDIFQINNSIAKCIRQLRDLQG